MKFLVRLSLIVILALLQQIYPFEEPMDPIQEKPDIIRFSSLYDTCMQIWDDSCCLFDCLDAQHEQAWIDKHDLVMGRLTRLKQDIAQLEQESKDENVVLITDFEYLVTVLKQIEEECLQHEQPEGHKGIFNLARAIREKIITLL